MSEVRHNQAKHRYEIEVDGHLSVSIYERDGDVLTFTHTLVPDELQGRGIASTLIRGALEDVRAQGLKLVPQCPFVAAYIDKHPEWRDVLA